LLARAATLAWFDNVAAARRLYVHQRSIASHSVWTALQWPQDQSAALSLSVIISQYFIGGMTPEICFHRFRDLAQGDTGTGDERFEQDVAWTCAKPLTAQGAMNPPSVSRFIVDHARAILLKMGLSSHSDSRSPWIFRESLPKSGPCRHIAEKD
jgi:hypothetical protein